MTTNPQDLHVAIIGSGSAAFAAALRLSEGGARVTLIEARTLGGTCVNVGCVPSKILLRAAHVAHMHRNHPFEGLERRTARLDFPRLAAQQERRVAQLRQAKYRDLLEDDARLELLQGFASLEDSRTVRVELPSGEARLLRPDRILLATGASPNVPSEIPGLADTPFWTSTEALQTEKLPTHLVVLGGGFVAVELAQAFRRLGSRVTLLARSTLLSEADPELGLGLAEVLETDGIDVRLHTVPTRIGYTDQRFEISLPTGSLVGDRLLVATGRKPNTEDLCLEQAGVTTDPGGAVIVDDAFRTSQPTVYAAGDCTSLPQYVYVAAAAGGCAADNMLGGESRLPLDSVPAVVFTQPQAAWVGLTEAQARRQGRSAESRVLPLTHVPRALANFETRGLIKMVAASDTGRLLGVQALAENAGEVIQTAALALHAQWTVQEVAERLFPYLTMVEGLKLAAQTFTKDVERLSCCAA